MSASSTEPTVDVTDNPAEHRFEVRYGGELAGLTVYEPEGDALAFVHTEVDPAFEGHGLGSKLVGAAMAAMEERGTPVIPYCPFVQAWLQKHPDHAHVVPADRRAEFGLG